MLELKLIHNCKRGPWGPFHSCALAEPASSGSLMVNVSNVYSRNCGNKHCILSKFYFVHFYHINMYFWWCVTFRVTSFNINQWWLIINRKLRENISVKFESKWRYVSNAIAVVICKWGTYVQTPGGLTAEISCWVGYREVKPLADCWPYHDLVFIAS